MPGSLRSVTNKFHRDKYNVILYFVRFRCSTLSPAEKRGKNSVATETKPSFLYKHQFATVHNLFSLARYVTLFIESSDLCFWTRGKDGKGEAKRFRGARMFPFGFRLINSHRRRVGTTIITSRWVDRKNENFFLSSLSSLIISHSLFFSSFLVRSFSSKYLQIFQSASLRSARSSRFSTL